MPENNEKRNLSSQHDAETNSTPQVPERLLSQADAAAFAAADDQSLHPAQTLPPIEDVPPPPYSAENYGEVDISENGLNTGAKVADDGRVDIKIDQINRRFTGLLAGQLAAYKQQSQPEPEPAIPEGLGYAAGLPPPRLNVVIHVVGSRGDVQPFVALGQVLKKKFNHRVRLATHPVFREFVTENGLEFFSIGGDPAELMAFMVKNPGLMPGVEALRSGDIGKRRKGIYEIANGCWRSCIEPGDGTGESASDDILDGRGIESAVSLGDPSAKPFVADAIIANPPSFAHIHIAEKLGIPLHLMFTMPWSPTQTYPHPLANIVSSNTDRGMTNFLSYIMVDLLTWQGIGDVINRFRQKALNLEPISIIWAPGSLHRLRIPWTYAWSSALIPKPADWGNFIDIAGFFFLDLATNYTPPPDLAEFLEAGPPPVYIGFGSIVVNDPNAMTQLIFEAVKITGQRALVSKGWGGLDVGELGQPEGVFMLGNCPHDWLFKHVSAVVHHGGAGTTAAGVKAGRPTVVVPFFGDQPFWGNMVNQAGAGPKPIHHKELTAQKLADAINEALKPDSLSKAKVLSEKIAHENGPNDGADTFHKRLNISELRCSICPGRAAVWVVKKTNIRLSTLAATVLANETLLEFSDLKLYRPREYEVDTGPPDPISGGAAALIGTIGSMTAGVADFPSEVLKSVKQSKAKNETRKKQDQGSSTGSNTDMLSATTSSSDLTSVTSPRGSTILGLGDQPIKHSQSEASNDDESERGRTTSRPRAGSSQFPSAMSTVMSSKGSSRTCSRCGKLFHSRSPSVTPNGRHSCRIEEAVKMTPESAIASAKAAGNIVAVGLKSPLDFTMSLAKGFHNIPRLYNDKTVRQNEKVTGFQSGVKVAGKNFAYGFMDGIGGLVTQPLQGFKEEGGVGLAKGMIKGSLGLIAKPGSAIYGLPAYMMQGVYAEITKNFGKSTTNYIIAARMAQGYDDFKESSAGERERIVSVWASGDLINEYKRKKSGKQKMTSKSSVSSTTKPSSTPQDRLVDENGQLLSGFRNTMGLSWDERKELARRKEEQKQQQEAQPPAPTDAEFEDAIRAAVQNTSNNNPDEDQAIENAIRASVRELQRSRTTEAEPSNDAKEDDDAYQRAVAASVAEFKRSNTLHDGQETGIVGENRIEMHDIDDDELTNAINASIASQRTVEKSTQQPDNEVDTDEDEDYKRALEESMKSQTASKRSAPPAYEQPSGPSTQNKGVNINQNNDNVDDDDAELQEALRLSELESKKSQEGLQKQLTEEEIVLEYIKKQSLQEEEFRKQRSRG